MRDLLDFDDDMCFWLLEQKQDAPWPSSAPTTAVVIATDEDEAREVAAKQSSTIWLDMYNSSCSPLWPHDYNKATLIYDSFPKDPTLEVADDYTIEVEPISWTIEDMFWEFVEKDSGWAGWPR